MADFSLFKNKMAVSRFTADEPTKISVDELREGLISYRFKEEPGLPVTCGFVDFVNLYGLDSQFHDRLHVFGTYFAGAIRFDKKSVPASAIKREVERECARFKETSGAKFIKREKKNEIKGDVTSYLLSRIPAKTSFVPFVVDMTTGNGYYYSTSKKDFELFEELLERAYGTSFSQVGFDEVDSDFLTYVWWSTESDSFTEMPLGKKLTKTFAGDKVSVSNDEQKVSVSGDIEEAKLSVSKGADVTKLEILAHIGEDERKFVASADGMISGLTYEASMLPEAESEELTPFIEATNDIFGLLDLWVKRYSVAQENGSGLTQEIRKSWGTGAYCSKAFEDI